MSKFSRSVAEELGNNPALSTLFGSLALDNDEGVAVAASIGSAVLGRLVWVSDASHSATPLADALLLVPYETISEALGDFDNLQSVGNGLLDGLFREQRGSAAIEIAREVNVATSAVGRLFPFVAPVIVAGLRAHGRRTGLSAEGLLSWLRTEKEGGPVREPQSVESDHLDLELPTGSPGADKPESLSASLASLLSPQPEDPVSEFAGVDGDSLDEDSDVAPSLLVNTDSTKPKSDFDFFGRIDDDTPLDDLGVGLAEPDQSPIDQPENPIDHPVGPVQTPPPPFDRTFGALDELPPSDPLADLRTASKGEMVLHEQGAQGGEADPGQVDPAMLVPEYRDIDHLREHGEREDVSTKKSSQGSFGVSGLAWLWWFVGSIAIVLLVALLLALAGSS